MGWETNLDPKKMPIIQDHGFDPPVLSMDEYVRFCARIRMVRQNHSSDKRHIADRDFPVNVSFRV